MADFDLVVTGNLVTAHRIVNDAFVAVSNGKIAFVGRGAPPAGREQIDARGQWVMPGAIDGQVNSGGQADQEGLGRVSRAAAAGGVTTLVDMPFDDPEPVWHGELLRAKAKQVERECHVDVALCGTISEAHGTATIAGLIEAGACAFKFSTFEAAPGRFPRIEEDLLHDAFALIAPSGLACGVHNQMQELTRKNIGRFTDSKETGWDAYGRAHTPLIEQLATAMIYELGALSGARAHVAYSSLARGFEVCEMYKAAGNKASIETCVQYLMLNGESDFQRLGAKLKYYPPLRAQAEVELLWTHVAAGRCNFVSSDHLAWALERKSNPNIFRNASGGPGLETLLPAFWTGCEQRGLSPSMVVKMLCEGPARHFMLRDRKGSFDLGSDADIVIAEPGRFVFDASRSLSAAQWSGFDGREMRIRVGATFVRGQLVFDGSKIVNKPGHGRFQRPRVPGGDRPRPRPQAPGRAPAAPAPGAAQVPTAAPAPRADP
jgi:allantoinase